MTKRILMTSLVATLATAGGALLMGTAPVSADVDNNQSDLKLNVEANDPDKADLVLTAVPNYNFGTVDQIDISNGFTRSEGPDTTNYLEEEEQNLEVIDGYDGDAADYKGWTLNASMTAFKNTSDEQLADSVTLKLNNAGANDTLTIANNPIGTGTPVEISKTTDDLSTTKRIQTAELPTANLDQPRTELTVNASDIFSSTVTWNLARSSGRAGSL